MFTKEELERKTGKQVFLISAKEETGLDAFAEAVEKMFDGVKVDSVRTMNVIAKQKRVGRSVGKTAAKKKAIVTLKADSKDIELFGATK